MATNPFSALLVATLFFTVQTIAQAQMPMQNARITALEENVRAIGLALFAYATDHENAYPTGKSSTEVFQKLIDGGYVSDPSLFYFELPGKSKANARTLKPENVCWDVTVPVTNNDPDVIPMVFATGYRVYYMPGGSAVPLDATAIKYTKLPVYYKSNSVKSISDNGQPDHLVKQILPPDFAPNGKAYQQLTPSGTLSPPKPSDP